MSLNDILEDINDKINYFEIQKTKTNL